jgi:NAD(P)-dependent dehydrogenase (short-subunit alcohol dehydrogenase family)
VFYNIRVNGITSGLVGADRPKRVGRPQPAHAFIPLRRIGQPGDVAETVFLALHKGGYITNAVLPVDAGG